MKKLVPAFLVALLTVSAFSQTKYRSAAEVESSTAARVASLDKRIADLLEPTAIERQYAQMQKYPCLTDCPPAVPQIEERSASAHEERFRTMDVLTAQIHKGIDTYIARAVRPSHVDPRVVGKRLTRVLGHAANGTPSAFVIDADDTKSLIVAYTLTKGDLMGRGATSVTLRAYTARQGAFRLTATAGDEMDGYAWISVLKLDPPVPNQLWVLLSGQYTGANGPSIRMRLYAYDRTKFKMPWVPEDSWGDFTIRRAFGGFTIDGDYYRETKRRHDRYGLSNDGVMRQRLTP